MMGTSTFCRMLDDFFRSPNRPHPITVPFSPSYDECAAQEETEVKPRRNNVTSSHSRRRLTGLGQTSDAHPRVLDAHGVAEFNDGDVVVERAQLEIGVPVDFGHGVHRLAAGFDLPVVFSDGDGQIFGVET